MISEKSSDSISTLIVVSGHTDLDSDKTSEDNSFSDVSTRDSLDVVLDRTPRLAVSSNLALLGRIEPEQHAPEPIRDLNGLIANGMHDMTQRNGVVQSPARSSLGSPVLSSYSPSPIGLLYGDAPRSRRTFANANANAGSFASTTSLECATPQSPTKLQPWMSCKKR